MAARPVPEPAVEEDQADIATGPETGTLLVVDSDADMRTMLVERFTRHGYRAIGLPTGAEALERLRDGGVDIVLLAMAMPRPSGPEVLRAIRQNWTPPELPVLMLSSQERARDLLYSLRLGANDYLPKGSDFNVLHARVRTQLMLKLTYEALRLSEERYEALADQSDDMIFQLSPTGEIVYASRSSRDVIGSSPQALVGRPFASLLSDSDAESLASRAMLGETFPELENELVRVPGRDRQPVELTLRMKVLRDPHGSGVVEIHGALSRGKQAGLSARLDDANDQKLVSAALARAGFVVLPDPSGVLRIVKVDDNLAPRR